MDYEQKYKDALAWVESIYPELNHEHQMEAKAFFSELAKSEDERIRKRIIQAIKIREKEMNEEWSDEIAWIEKQGSEPNWCHHKMDEETINKDLEYAALLHYPKMSRVSEPHGVIPADNKSHYLGDANEDNRKAFMVGAQWQKEQDQSTIELAEDHAYFAGSENTRKKLIEKACKWWEDKFIYPTMTSDEIEYYKSKFEDFRKAMEE